MTMGFGDGASGELFHPLLVSCFLRGHPGRHSGLVPVLERVCRVPPLALGQAALPYPAWHAPTSAAAGASQFWHVCDGLPIAGPKDFAFYQGKLYVLLGFLARLHAFELEEGDHGVVVSRVEHCVIEGLHDHHIQQISKLSCNIVVWRHNLLLIVRRYDTTSNGFPRPNRELHHVQVFVLDFSTNPCGLTEIHSFDGDCVFVDSCGCNSFPASLYDGAEGDRIYFVDQYSKYDVNSVDPSYDTFVYTVRNGRTRPLATELSPDNFGAPNGNLDVPLLLLTSK
ncbi:hypothetical protein HU200_048727 [Digitaria exilis]|uniref:KIB1-4 beta-propeller domain-containing protein n=1 Tax=Digitaria exilis TaxID=1010633 RepID=A0A835ECH8_9POAL|nr:hypothetical protein HU200_048727 [Digitaria exilis]